MRAIQLVVLIMVSSSASAQSEIDPYKTVIYGVLEDRLKDFESAKLKDWTGPVQGELPPGARKKRLYGEWVCVRVNSKNSYGAYTGYQLNGFFFQDGELKHIQWGKSQAWEDDNRKVCRLNH